ncbi:MAG: hypothetical protein AABZ39_15295 [Spirochaetota bacterium]
MQRLVSLFPALAFMLFWLAGGLLPAIVSGRAELVVLGAVTLPVVAVMIMSAVRSYRR